MMAVVSAKAHGTNSTNVMERRCRPTKLFIGGLTRRTTTKTLRDHFCSYGSVLDCVAMRMADGKPRGFGYVTLDSPAAADRILAEPQLIDGRVVEMKRAVPEGSGTSPQGASAFPKDHLGLYLGEPMRVPEPMLSSWAGVQYPCSSAATFLGTRPMALPQAGHFIASTPVAPGQGCSHLPWSGSPLAKTASEQLDCVQLIQGGSSLRSESPISPPVGLSAGAPEFIPNTSATQASGLEQTAEDGENAGGCQHRGTCDRATKQPIVELSDITNVINNIVMEGKDCRMEQTVSSTPVGPAGLPLLSTAHSFEDGDSFEIRVDSSDEEVERQAQAKIATNAVMKNDNNKLADNSKIGMGPSAQSAEHLPSVGSVDHMAGTCKRCNFFSKGRCQNGKKCTFCHFPHEKRKLSRQEKRERRSVWLLQNEEGSADESGASDSADSESDAQKITAYSILPGMPPIQATALPAPLPLPGSLTMETAYPGVPPCLPPGLVDMWEPDDETSPLCVSSFNGTPLSSAPGIGSLSTPHGGGLVLSTIPWASSTPQSAVATPLGSVASIPPFAAEVAEPVSMAEKMGLLSKPSATLVTCDATPAVIVSTVPETCSVGTQTDQSSGKLCSKCRDETNGVMKMVAAHGGA